MKAASFFVDLVGMSGRPEFYSGRGPKPCDLDGHMLERMFQAVLEHNGAGAAESFLAMVASLKLASATSFLLNPYNLERQGWAWKDDDEADARGWDLGEDRERMHGLAFATVISALGSSRNDDEYNDRAVRGGFLRAHGYTLDKGKWRKTRSGDCFQAGCG